MDKFVQFLRKYGVIGLAIAFVISSAVMNLASAFVNDIPMPVITFFPPRVSGRISSGESDPSISQSGTFSAQLSIS